jgi:hypothetical protein
VNHQGIANTIVVDRAGAKIFGIADRRSLTARAAGD